MMMMSSLPPFVPTKASKGKTPRSASKNAVSQARRVKRRSGKLKQSITSLEKQALPFQRFPIRLLFLFAVLVLGVLVMTGRFFWIQIIDGANLSNRARLSH